MLSVGLQNINTKKFSKVTSFFQFQLTHIPFLAFGRHQIPFGAQFHSPGHWENVGGMWEWRGGKNTYYHCDKWVWHDMLFGKNFLQKQINTTVWTQTTMSLRPCRDCNVRLADSTNVQFLKMFLHQLCIKVQSQHMKDGLGVRIYNVRNYRLYVSRTSESQGLPIHCLAYK